MKKLATATSLAILLGIGSGVALAQGTKLSQAECQNLWNQADSAQSGSLSTSQAQPYVTNFKAVDTNADSKLSSSEFLAGCQKGLVHSSSSSGAGSGASGSKSYK